MLGIVGVEIILMIFALLQEDIPLLIFLAACMAITLLIL